MAFCLMVICCLSSSFELSGKGHTVSAFSSFGMGHLLSLVQNLCRDFCWGPVTGTCCRTAWPTRGILDTVAPRSLQVCPSSQVAPLKIQLQLCELSQQLCWAVNSRQCFALLLTGRSEAIHPGCGKRGSPCTSETNSGRHWRAKALSSSPRPWKVQRKWLTRTVMKVCPFVSLCSL